MSKILITGIGLTSKLLGKHLRNKGYSIQYLTRNPNNHSTFKSYKWDVENSYIDIEAFANVDFIIHLTGAGISDKRWSRKRKKEILDSRILPTRLLYNYLKENQIRVKGIIATSAIGYYGAITTSRTFTESDDPANDFIGQVCVQWENEISKFNKLQIRMVILRTGVVLTPIGGALSKITSPIRFHFGAALGTGNQIIPWIHIDDLCNIYFTILKSPSFSGIFNAVAPSYDSNEHMTNLISRKLNNYVWLPNIPSIVLKVLFGEMASLLLHGSKVSCEKIKTFGFKFKYDSLKKAIDNLID